MSSAIDCDALEVCWSSGAGRDDLSSASTARDDGDYADDATWVLTSSFVILTMQSGFGLLEMGSCVTGNEVNIMLKNVYDVIFGGLAYYLLGYGISYGSPSNSFMGLGDFVPDGGNTKNPDSGLLHSRYLFQFSFAATATTIVSGCIAGRMRFFVYCIFAFYSVITYSFVAHWIWADDGWLHRMGVHDFAGCGPVHLFGGINGLVAILYVGPRAGRFDGTRPATEFVASSPVSQIFGLFVLWWGWIGFNCGSTFGITSGKWMVATRVGVTTINSTVSGGLVALAYALVKTNGKYVNPSGVVNGILGALVAISASCASVHTYDALIIGAISAFVALGANDFVETRLQLDDPGKSYQCFACVKTLFGSNPFNMNDAHQRKPPISQWVQLAYTQQVECGDWWPLVYLLTGRCLEFTSRTASFAEVADVYLVCRSSRLWQ